MVVRPCVCEDPLVKFAVPCNGLFVIIILVVIRQLQMNPSKFHSYDDAMEHMIL